MAIFIVVCSPQLTHSLNLPWYDKLHGLMLALFFIVVISVFIIELLYAKHPVYVLTGFVFCYYVVGFPTALEYLAPVHVYLTLLLGYLCYLSQKGNGAANSNYVLISILITGFLVFSGYWDLILVLVGSVVLASFLFLLACPNISRYLGLSVEPEPNLLPFVERVMAYFSNIFYDPKYLSLMSFWEKTFPKRIAKGGGSIFLEVVSLVFLSLSTILHTRYRILIPAFFIRCWLYDQPLLALIYFLVIFFLTVLVYIPQYNRYMKTIYGDNVFKNIGWNSPAAQLLSTTAKGTLTLVGFGTGIALDDHASIHYLNPLTYERSMGQFIRDNQIWENVRVSAGGDPETFPNKPKPPNREEIYSRRIRHSLYEAIGIKNPNVGKEVSTSKPSNSGGGNGSTNS